MPTMKDMFPSKWLAAKDIEDDEVVKIRGLTQEKVGMDGDQKWVLWFHGIEKGLVLNKTNSKTISGLLGEDTDDWEDREITLFSTEVDFQGETVDAIRVRRKLPKPSAARTMATEDGPAPAPAKRKVPIVTQAEADEDVPF